MGTISWVGPSARKLVGESHQPNPIETLGVATELGTSLGFVPALLPRAVWLMMINGKVSVPTQVVPLCSCFLSYQHKMVEVGRMFVNLFTFSSFSVFASHLMLSINICSEQGHPW